MALRFIDGWDHYATADLTEKWTSLAGSGISIIASGRNGSSCLKYLSGTTSSAQSHITKVLDSQASWVIGVAYYLTMGPGSITLLLELLDAGTTQVDLRLNLDQTLSVTRNGNAVTGGTSASALSLNTWYYIEWKVTIADSIGAGSCKVRVNGADWITVATGQDTKNTGNATANQVRVGNSKAAGTSGTATGYFDDLYVLDGQAGLNDFLGDCRVEALFPTADGATVAWTASAGSDYACVDETAPNDDTDYISSSTADQVDTFVMGDLSSTPSAVFGVQTVLSARKDDAGVRTIAPVLRPASTDRPGTNVNIGDTYTYYLECKEGNPDGGSWDSTSINATEVGVKLIA